MKRRMLHQLAADHIQSLLRGPVAYAVAIAGESTLDDFCMVAVGEGMKDQAYRLFIRSACRPSDARDAYAETCFAPGTNSFRKRRRNLAANSAVFRDQQRRHFGQSCL